MNYYRAEQAGNGRWYYIMTAYYNGQHSRRLGYCATCDGHEYQEEAEIHYREWVTDQAVYGAGLGYYVRCALCPTLAYRYVASGPGHAITAVLCDQHRTREGFWRVLTARNWPKGFWSGY